MDRNIADIAPKTGLHTINLLPPPITLCYHYIGKWCRAFVSFNSRCCFARLVLVCAGAMAMIGCDSNLSSTSNGLDNSEQVSRNLGGDVLANVRAESFEGIFALSKAEAPKGFEGMALGSFAWWNDFSSEQLFLYGRLINSSDDVHDALINLERDLGIDSSDMIAELSMVGRESNEANRLMDPAGWEPATFALSLEIMGFDPAEFIEAGNKLNDPLTPTCIAAKGVAAYEASLKSMPSILKSILIAGQSSCGGGGCQDPCDCAHCLDDSVCNGEEYCEPGVGCMSGPGLICNDQNYCNGHETCDSIEGCQSGEPPVCDDKNVCNGLEFCLDNELVTGCQPGTPLDCSDDGNACNGPEFCDSVAGCQSGPPPVCNDGNACNGLETCDPVNGCQAGIPPMCDDHNYCNGTETCIPSTGCKPGIPPVCDDGDTCNGLETCNASAGCIPGTPKNCDDSDECTIDDCANSACFHTENFDRPHCPDGSCCGDGNPETADSCVCSNPPECTIYDCVHTFVCDDGNSCTVDSCTPDASGSCSENTPCTHEVQPDCTVCPGGVCVAGVCESRSCNIGLTSATGCPGGSVSMNMAVTCSSALAACSNNGTWNVSTSASDLSLFGGGNFTCPSGSDTVIVEINNNAAPRPVPVIISANIGSVTCDATDGILTIDECVSLSFAGVGDEDETTVGGFICLNDDDDNGNGTPDKNDVGLTANEDDLRPLTISLKAGLTGSVSLSVIGTQIKLFTGLDRSGPLSISPSWMASELSTPKTIYVEGFATSVSARDVEIKATYTGDGGPCEDKVKVTVIDVDMVAGGVPEAIEETPPGFKIATNNDFDEGKTNLAGNPIADNTDASPISADGTSIAFNGLISCSASVFPENDESLGGSVITVTQTGGTGSVRMLAINPAAIAPFDDDWVEVPFGLNLLNDFYLSTGMYNTFDSWIEGRTPGPVELTMKFVKDGITCEDKVLLNVVEYAIVTIDYKTFIHCGFVQASWPGPTWPFYSGDGREFGESGSSRTREKVFASVNPMSGGGLVQEPMLEMGETHGYITLVDSVPPILDHCSILCRFSTNQGQQPNCVETAPINLSVESTRINSDEIQIRLRVFATLGCSLSALTPAIDADITVIINQTYSNGLLAVPVYKLVGHSDAFPWHEMFIDNQFIRLVDPCLLLTTPNELFPPEEIMYNTPWIPVQLDP